MPLSGWRRRAVAVPRQDEIHDRRHLGKAQIGHVIRLVGTTISTSSNRGAAVDESWEAARGGDDDVEGHARGR